jgi:hypothetical protein
VDTLGEIWEECVTHDPSEVGEIVSRQIEKYDKSVGRAEEIY